MTAAGPHREWLDQAHRDRMAAEQMSTVGFHEWACFCAQQAVEKAIKAVYVALGMTPPKDKSGHDLAYLFRAWADLLAREDPGLAQAQMTLRGHETNARYPGEGGPGAPAARYGPIDSEYAVRVADRLLAICDDLAQKAGSSRSRCGSSSTGGGGNRRSIGPHRSTTVRRSWAGSWGTGGDQRDRLRRVARAGRHAADAQGPTAARRRKHRHDPCGGRRPRCARRGDSARRSSTGPGGSGVRFDVSRQAPHRLLIGSE
jgi:HEPN domain-containing protein